MKCAYDKDRECTNECTAYKEVEDIRRGKYMWDTSDPNPQYKDIFNTIIRGVFCRRMGYLIDDIRIVKKDGCKIMDVEK